MPFALNSNPNLNEISDAINYLLSNFGSNVSIDIANGIIAGPTGRISNLYKYIQIKYATSYDGSVGFSNVPTNAIYYGIRNNNSPTESTEPNDYIWNKTTGFGTTNYLWYTVAGGRQIDFYVSPTAPSEYYVVDPGTSIDIDIVTTTKTINVAYPTIYQWTSGTAPARPSTTSTYTWATASFSAPSGWTTTPSTNSTPGYVQFAIVIPLNANSNVATSLLDWTNTSYPIIQYNSNGATGTTGGSGLSALTGYKVQAQNVATPSFTTPTSGSALPTGWYSTLASALSAAGLSSIQPFYVIWYIFGQYNSTSATLSGVPANSTAWTGPTAASVFQDIESDNWNGGVPPTSGPYSPLGTAGYYIQRSTGNMYLNSIYGRGVSQFDGATPTGSGSYAAVVANLSNTQRFGVYALSSSGSTGIGVYGNSNSGVALQGDSVTGYGIVASSVVGTGIYASGGTYGIYSQGPMGTSSTNLVNNLYAQYAYNLVGQFALTPLYFYKGPSVGASVITFTGTNKPGTSTTTNSWIEFIIGGTSYQIPVWAT